MVCESCGQYTCAVILRTPVYDRLSVCRSCATQWFGVPHHTYDALSLRGELPPYEIDIR